MITLPWVIEAIVRQALLKGANTMGTNRNQYIHNVASTVLGQVGDVGYAGWPEHDFYEPELPDYPQTFWNLYGHKVMDVVGKMGSSARGRILACGVTCPGNGMVAYHEVDDGLCTAEVSGDELLTLLASYVVAAAIVDITRAGIQHERRLQDSGLLEDDDKPVDPSTTAKALADLVAFNKKNPHLLPR